MRLPQTCLCLLITMGIACHAIGQEKETLYEEITTIGPLKKFEWAGDATFNLGDKLLLNVDVMNGRKISKIVIDEPGGQFQLVAKNIQAIERKRFTAKREGKYVITFHNKAALPKKARIKIEKIVDDKFEDKRILDDLIVTVFEDSIQRVEIDTIPWPDLIETEVELSPTRNYGQVSAFCDSFPLLAQGAEQFAVYWVGIGNEALAAYEEIKNDPPPAWLMKGINEPLVAFGMGLTRTLPITLSSLSKSVVIQVRRPDRPIDINKDIEKNALNPDGGLQSPPFGVIGSERAKKYGAVQICAKNFNTMSGVKVFVKIARFSIVKKTVYDRVIRERAQEVFIIKPTKVEDENQ